MTAANFVSRLTSVRSTGPGRWIACCPAHDDQRPSLSVREADDGRTILLKCFGGCDCDAICAAVGLKVSDLFPPRENVRHDQRQRRERIAVADALACIRNEAMVALIAVRQVQSGESLTAEDADRVSLAVARIQGALDATQ